MKGESILFERFVFDLKKPKPNKLDRARMISEYMRLKKLSIRAFAEKFDLRKSTVEDWLLWNRINNEQYKEMIEQGYTQTDIYRTLRNNKDTDIAEFTALDLLMDNATFTLSSTHLNSKVSIHTKEKLKMLKKAVSTFEFRLEKYKK